jgi:peptidyl-tRNA hydrolase
MASQIAHASILSLLREGTWEGNTFTISNMDETLKYWMKESFTKIVVKAWGENQLRGLEREASRKGIRTALFTEDDGQVTCLALGPDLSKNLDPLTGALPLL